MRRFGHSPKANISYRLRPGAYAVLQRGPQVLLTHQDGLDPEFQLPGGGIDPGESPLKALHREVMEETGWRISAPVRLGAFRRFVFMPEYDMYAEKVCHVYLARPTLELCAPLEAGHTSHWIPMDIAADRLANPGDKAFLKQLL